MNFLWTIRMNTSQTDIPTWIWILCIRLPGFNTGHIRRTLGWGQITTPYGTFDAIRVQHYITESDSINFEGNWFGIPVPDSYIYEWLATGEKEPILRIRTSEIGGNEVVTAVEYKDYFQPTLAVEDVQMEVQV